jgi:hypothetical protein
MPMNYTARHERSSESKLKEALYFLSGLLQMECIGINKKEGGVNQDVISDGTPAKEFTTGGRRVT